MERINGLVWMLKIALGSSVTMPLLYTEGGGRISFLLLYDTRSALLLRPFVLHRSEQKLYLWAIGERKQVSAV